MTDWAVHAYMLMRNHYHLLLEIPEEKQQKRLLRKRTTVSHGWNVEHLNVGSRYSVHNAVKAIESLEGTKNRTWRKQILQINNSLH